MVRATNVRGVAHGPDELLYVEVAHEGRTNAGRCKPFSNCRSLDNNYVRNFVDQHLLYEYCGWFVLHLWARDDGGGGLKVINHEYVRVLVVLIAALPPPGLPPSLAVCHCVVLHTLARVCLLLCCVLSVRDLTVKQQQTAFFAVGSFLQISLSTLNPRQGQRCTRKSEREHTSPHECPCPCPALTLNAKREYTPRGGIVSTAADRLSIIALSLSFYHEMDDGVHKSIPLRSKERMKKETRRR